MNKQELIALKPEKRISHYAYNLKAILGKGSYGTVFLGKNLTNNELVAIKVVERTKVDLHSKEVEIMKKLKNPNIVQLLDVQATLNNSYIITEYCNGVDLKVHLQQNKKIPEEQAIKFLRQTVNGLKEIIQNNYIHRDLKPANIILSDFQCKIADFGFSRYISDDQIMQSLVGTPLYMAPQILSRQAYSSKCDIWSLGVIYYEMLFGVTPFVATNILDLVWKLQNSKLQFPKNHKISDLSIQFLMGCLQKEENQRFDWKDLFNHSIIKPRMNIQIDPSVNEIFRPQFSTHRPGPQKLPNLARDRSCSQNQAKVQIQSQQTQQTQQNDLPTSSQSTECEENQQKQYFVVKPNAVRRTKSQLDYQKNNQSDLTSKRNIIQSPPIQVPLKQNFTSRVHLKNITQLFERQRSPTILSPKFDGQQQYIQLLLQIEALALQQGLKDLEKYISNERFSITKRLPVSEDRIQKAYKFLRLNDNDEIKRMLEIYIKLLQMKLFE